MQQVAKIKKASLIVPAQMADAKKRKKRIFHLVLVTGGGAKFRHEVAGLRVNACAVVLAGIRKSEITKLRGSDSGRIRLGTSDKGIRGVETLEGVGAEDVIIRLGTADFV